MRCIYRRRSAPHNLMMVKKRQEPERIAIPMPAELIQRIDEYRWTNRLPSRAAAIRQLIEAGLKSKQEKP
jgi:metal-responsive CopG/Arc/MetJ family transcriptional regulator